MKQNIIWKPFLKSGIRFSLYSILLLISCRPDHISYIYYKEFVFKNETDFQLKVDAINFFSFVDRTPENFSAYIIESKDSLTQVNSNGDMSSYRIEIAYSDSVVVTFGNKKSISFTPGDHSRYNSLNFRNFNIDSVSEYRSRYTYTFTQEDYNNAAPLVFGEGFVGSVWRCTEGEGVQEGLLYNELRFISNTEVEGWVQAEGEALPEFYFTVGYSIEGETITVFDDDDFFIATLNKDHTGLLTNISEEGECVFYKQ